MRGFTEPTDPLTNRAVATGSLKCRPWWIIQLGIAVAMLFGQASLAVAANKEAAGYRIVESIAGPDGAWDYSAIDSESRRLYLAQGGIAVLDLNTHKWLSSIAPETPVSGVIPIPALHKLIFSDGKTFSLVVYDTMENRIVGSIPSKKGRTDAVAYDSSTHTAALMTALGEKAGNDG